MKPLFVGYWCSSCLDLLPQENRLCKCMDLTEKPEAAAAHKKSKWFPVFAHIPKYGTISPFN